MNENIIEILHHNRDREVLMSRCDIRTFGDTTTKERREALATRAMMAQMMLTPKDDTRMLFKDYETYIDVSKAGDSRYVYSGQDVAKSIQHCIQHSGKLSKSEYEWLIWRGVTSKQIKKFNLFSFDRIKSEEDRIRLGIEIHPSTQHWIGHKTPKGIVIPVKSIYGDFVGSFLRFLSTVPKIKFGSAIPGAYVYTNLTTESKPERIHLVEGVFDGLAVDKQGGYFISPSSGFWCPEQLFILDSIIALYDSTVIYANFDNDRIGARGNVFITMVLREYNIIPTRCPNKECKDVSELVNKYELDILSMQTLTLPEAMEHYRSFSYKPFVSYDHYLDNRQAAYDNANYDWKN